MNAILVYSKIAYEGTSVCGHKNPDFQLVARWTMKLAFAVQKPYNTVNAGNSGINRRRK